MDDDINIPYESTYTYWMSLTRAPGLDSLALLRVPDLDSLALLLEVDAHGSLGRAAQTHGISQPAATARIKGIERLVGFSLIERSTRGSRLTPAGALVADWARDVLDSARVLDAGIASLRSDRERRLRVGASLTIAEHLLPGWLVRLAVARPETAVSLRAMNSADVQAAMLASDIEFGFVEGPMVPRRLASQVIGQDELVLVVPPGHRWARRRRPVSATELAETRLVHREPTSGTRAALEAALAMVGPMVAPVLELSTGSAVRSAVAAGAGPAVLSRLAVRDDVATGRLAEVPVSDVDLSRRLRAVWRHGERPPAPALELLRIAAHAQSPRRP